MTKQELQIKREEASAKYAKAFNMLQKAETIKEAKFYRSAINAHLATIKAIDAMLK